MHINSVSGEEKFVDAEGFIHSRRVGDRETQAAAQNRASIS